jgi:hypothetical protein
MLCPDTHIVGLVARRRFPWSRSVQCRGHTRDARRVCRLGLSSLEQNPERARREGIVSKRLGSTYRSGRSTQWVKVKNPAAPLLAPNQP